MKNSRARFLSSIFRPPLEKDGRREKACLDKNESAFSAFGKVDEIFTDNDIKNLNLYPDPYETYEKLSIFLDVDINSLLITHGSEQILSYIFHSFLQKGDKVVFPNPSYAMYSVYAQEIEAEVKFLNYSNDMSLDLCDMLNSIDKDVSMFVLANPDNHTGSSLSLKEIEEICKKTQDCSTLFLLDEAYFYYIEIDTISLLKKYKNLVITRSCSKACGLAGARIGYGLADRSIIDILRVHKPMHEMNTLNNIVFNKLLDNPRAIIDKNVSQVNKWKKIFKSISNEEVLFISTDTNFIIIKIIDEKIYNLLKERFINNNIAVRLDFSHISMKNCIRFSVGEDSVMDKVFKIVNISQNGWIEEETVNFYKNSRIKYEELYDSERYFLSKEYIKNINTILDVGCAIGGFYEIFNTINPKIEYTGIDISEKSILTAESKYKNKSNCTFIKYSGSLPLPLKNKYSFVYCSGLLHLIDNWKEMLENLFKVSSNEILFDLRISQEISYYGKYYFDFADKGDRNNFTNYHIVNGREALSFVIKTGKFSEIEIFGYQGRSNNKTEGIKDGIYMTFFKCKVSKEVSYDPKIKFNNELKEIIK